MRRRRRRDAMANIFFSHVLWKSYSIAVCAHFSKGKIYSLHRRRCTFFSCWLPSIEMAITQTYRMNRSTPQPQRLGYSIDGKISFILLSINISTTTHTREKEIFFFTTAATTLPLFCVCAKFCQACKGTSHMVEAISVTKTITPISFPGRLRKSISALAMTARRPSLGV